MSLSIPPRDRLSRNRSSMPMSLRHIGRPWDATHPRWCEGSRSRRAAERPGTPPRGWMTNACSAPPSTKAASARSTGNSLRSSCRRMLPWPAPASGSLSRVEGCGSPRPRPITASNGRAGASRDPDRRGQTGPSGDRATITARCCPSAARAIWAVVSQAAAAEERSAGAATAIKAGALRSSARIAESAPAARIDSRSSCRDDSDSRAVTSTGSPAPSGSAAAAARVAFRRSAGIGPGSNRASFQRRLRRLGSDNTPPLRVPRVVPPIR